MNNNKKPLNEAEIISRLKQGRVSFPPLSLRFKERKQPKAGARLDGLVEITWAKVKADFALEIKALSTPKAFMDALSLLKNTRLTKNLLPMLIVPFLNEERLKELEKEGISGIDLCGNGIVTAADKFAIYRTGQPNRFPSYSPIKNVYRKNSSLVSRLFLVRPVFTSVNEVLEGIKDLDFMSKALNRPSINLSTVSKALAEMENDLIISRNNGQIRLLQPEVLLDKLSENYRAPENRSIISLKVDLDRLSLLKRLAEYSKEANTPVMVGGLSSVSRYAVMQRGEEVTIYSARPEEVIKQLPGKETDKFANLKLVEIEDATVYFDAREENGLLWSSPVQTYLELMKGDKRDQETAQQVRNEILTPLKKTLQ